MTDKIKKVLVLAPHTDDGELGCGGSISRFIEEGKDVFYVAFSTCEESVPAEFEKDSLEKEVKIATKILGIDKKNLIIMKYPVRKFSYQRQEILEDLVLLRDQIKPDLVCLPCSTSFHQDHQVIYQEGLRCFKHSICLGYDLPWDASNFTAAAFIKLENRHFEKKFEAITAYKSQYFRNYTDKLFVQGLARVRGAQAGCEYAEAFEAIRVFY